MKRLAIPIQRNVLSQYFGQCNYYNIVDLEDNVLLSTHKKELPAVRAIEEMPQWLSNQGVTDIVAHRMDSKIVHLFSKYKIAVFIGIPIATTEKIVDDYKKGVLKSDEKLIQEIINIK